MFGMSMTEILIILVVALVILGPKELPNIAKTLGKTLRDVRRAGDDLRDTFDREVMRDPVPPKPHGPPADAVPREALHLAPSAEPLMKPAELPAATSAAAPTSDASAPTASEPKVQG